MYFETYASETNRLSFIFRYLWSTLTSRLFLFIKQLTKNRFVTELCIVLSQKKMNQKRNASIGFDVLLKIKSASSCREFATDFQIVTTSRMKSTMSVEKDSSAHRLTTQWWAEEKYISSRFIFFSDLIRWETWILDFHLFSKSLNKVLLFPRFRIPGFSQLDFS